MVVTPHGHSDDLARRYPFPTGGGFSLRTPCPRQCWAAFPVDIDRKSRASFIALAANRLTLPFLPRLRPVANGGFFFEKRRPPPRAGPARALAPDRPALWSLQIPDSPAAFPDRPTRAGPAPSLLSLSSPRRATAIVGLDRRTRNRAVGTEYATVTSQRLKPHPAALAVIEEKAGIGRHGLDGSMTA